MSVTNRSDGNKRFYKLKIVEKSINLNVELDFDYNEVPSSVIVVPMSVDKTYYFAALKKPGLKLTGSYSYQGKNQTCYSGDCLMMIDTGRTHTPYGVAYYWIMFMTKLPDGRIVTVNGGDGMGTKYQGMDQASEDFISIDKDFYRLDLFRMISDDNQKKVSEKRFKTAEATNDYKRIFPQNNCDLTFEPVISNSD